MAPITDTTADELLHSAPSIPTVSSPPWLPSAIVIISCRMMSIISFGANGPSVFTIVSVKFCSGKSSRRQ